MAYAATVTVTPITAHLGDRVQEGFSVTIAETGAKNTDQWDTAGAGTGVTLTGVTDTDWLPAMGRIVRYVADLTAGTGTTLDPVVGTVTDPASTPASVVLENGTAADPIDLQPADGGAYYAPTGILYGRNVVNDATADHAITTKILILSGW